MLDPIYEPNGAMRSFLDHIELHTVTDVNANTARKQEKPIKIIKSFPYSINNSGPPLKKYFWLDAHCPEVIKKPYDDHDNLNYSPLRYVQDRPVQVGARLISPSNIKPLRFGR